MKYLHFQKMAHIVTDIALSCNKDVKIIHGQHAPTKTAEEIEEKLASQLTKRSQGQNLKFASGTTNMKSNFNQILACIKQFLKIFQMSSEK